MVETSAQDIAKANAIIHPHDVLMGRGGATNSHPGNRNFRELVAREQSRYLLAKKKDKIGIAKLIVAEIHEKGGRFLRRTPKDDWEVVSDKRAQEKTSQCLREGLDVRNSKVRTIKVQKPTTEEKETTPVVPSAPAPSPLAALQLAAQSILPVQAPNPVVSTAPVSSPIILVQVVHPTGHQSLMQLPATANFHQSYMPQLSFSKALPIQTLYQAPVTLAKKDTEPPCAV